MKVFARELILVVLYLKGLYGLGVRRIGVTSLPPVGCLPSQRTLRGGLERNCVDEYNEAARLFNEKLSAELASINAQLGDALIVYIDIYNLPLNFIKNPQKYGKFDFFGVWFLVFTMLFILMWD